MRLIIAGPGRAGLSLGLRAVAVGHEVVGVLGRTDTEEAAARLDSQPLVWAEDLPHADLLILAVRDDAIESVAGQVATYASSVEAAVHLSGLTPVAALAALADEGCQTGAFHPLQTLPTPEAGSAKLAGAWIAITAEEPLRGVLEQFAEDMGAHPFLLPDEAKALYHAAAAAASNFVVTVLDLADQLFEGAGVPLAAARPLSEAVVANAFALGPAASLTGPIARGDVGTVAAQLDAVRRLDAGLAETYESLGRATARVAGNEPLFEEVWRESR